MAKDPTSIKEVNIVVESIEKRFDLIQKTFDGRISDLNKAVDARLDVLQRVTWFACGLIGTLILGGISMLVQLSSIKTDTAVLQSEMTTLKKQQSDMAGGISTLRASLTRIENRLTSTIPTPLAPAPTADLDAPLKLTSVEQLALRIVLGVKKTGERPKYAVGDKLPSTQELPAELANSLTRLKDYRYANDPSGAVLLASPNGRVVAIIEG